MGLHDAVSAERLHIGFFGMRNTGKSSLVNAVTGQQLSVVSDVKGTTTDPVKKAMELLPLGPVVVIDTPGFDDEGQLGQLRVQKTMQILAQTDIAVLVADSRFGLQPEDARLIKEFQERKLPYIIVFNKADLLSDDAKEKNGADSRNTPEKNVLYASAVTGEGIHSLKEALGKLARNAEKSKFLIADLLKPGDLVILVAPIDESAPKGRLILPQQITLREILDANCIGVICQDEELKITLEALGTDPKLVITDSQVFQKVSADTPEKIPLTSFSILMARYKGDLKELVRGVATLPRLQSGDRVLISEGCTHHRQCNDIGTVKLPRWIETFTGIKPEFTFSSGGDFPEDLSDYSMIVHCGGCMLNDREMAHRIEKAKAAKVPIVNYGIAIAQMNGILERSLQPFPDILELLTSSL